MGGIQVFSTNFVPPFIKQNMANIHLTDAKRAKNDEFYTQY
jgi:hypothetical protein